MNETDRVRLANAIDAITVEHAIHEDIVTSAVARWVALRFLTAPHFLRCSLEVDAEEQKAQVMAHFEECDDIKALSEVVITYSLVVSRRQWQVTQHILNGMPTKCANKQELQNAVKQALANTDSHLTQEVNSPIIVI